MSVNLVIKKINYLWLFRACVITIWIIIVLKLPVFKADSLALTVSMFFGSFLGSATPVGGGAVVFPVLTLIMHTPPNIAATYSLAIQSFGMGAASIAILVNKIRINWSLLLVSIPFGMLGFTVSYFLVAIFLSPATIMIFFTSFWLVFGYVLSKTTDEGTLGKYGSNGRSEALKYFVFSLFSFVGGFVTAWIGNGMDIIFFSMAVILFGERESVATPSSVIIMAVLSMFGSIINVMTDRMPQMVQGYLAATIPVVIFMAPLGAIFISKKNDKYIKKVVLYLVCTQYLVTMFVVCKSVYLALFSAMVIAASMFFVVVIRRARRARCQGE
jgi:uncharacterized membrane protein YfcA